VELEAARRIAAQLADRHIVMPLDLTAFGGSALTSDIAVPKGGLEEGIPVTYVPARNTVFLSLALAWAEAAGARDLFVGVNALDYSGYPDCRPDFIAHEQGRHCAGGGPARPRRGDEPQLLRPGARWRGLRPVRRMQAARQRI
jgi:7-cyano-7-deazaguanine synthase